MTHREFRRNENCREFAVNRRVANKAVQKAIEENKKIGISMKQKQTWVLEDHICRHCSGGRILRCVSGGGPTGGGNPIYTCADCGVTTSAMGPDALCWCGMSFKNQNMTEYMCMPFSILKEKPYLLNAFLSCGCDPKRGVVGIMTKDSYKKAEESTALDRGKDEF